MKKFKTKEDQEEFNKEIYQEYKYLNKMNHQKFRFSTHPLQTSNNSSSSKKNKTDTINNKHQHNNNNNKLKYKPNQNIQEG